MKAKQYGRVAGGLIVGGAALAAAAYATYAGITWLRYGHSKRHVRGDQADVLLDLYMPEYEVAERHYVVVAAPAETTFSAACNTDLSQSAIVQTLCKLRELALRCSASKGNRAPANAEAAEAKSPPKELLTQIKAIGWGVLAEVSGHEIVFGAATQPWVANPVFRTLAPKDFAEFREPGYVKIAWTLRADPISARESIARTETRVVTTDAFARAQFRRYWSVVSPGVVLIRKVLLRAVKTDAERRARAAEPQYETAEFGQYAG